MPFYNIFSTKKNYSRRCFEPYSWDDYLECWIRDEIRHYWYTRFPVSSHIYPRSTSTQSFMVEHGSLTLKTQVLVGLVYRYTMNWAFSATEQRGFFSAVFCSMCSSLKTRSLKPKGNDAVYTLLTAAKRRLNRCYVKYLFLYLAFRKTTKLKPHCYNLGFC